MLAVWLFAQLGALALAAGRVPLSANWVQPGERGASIEMLVVQIATSALLFPELLKDFNRAVIVAASAWPMLWLAGLLGGEDASNIYAAATYVTVWIGVLSIWRNVLSSERARMIGAAAAGLWCIGGPFLLYLHAEFGGAAEAWPGKSSVWTAAAGPVWGAVVRLNKGWVVKAADLPLIVLLLAVIICAILRILNSKHKTAILSTELSTL